MRIYPRQAIQPSIAKHALKSNSKLHIEYFDSNYNILQPRLKQARQLILTASKHNRYRGLRVKHITPNGIPSLFIKGVDVFTSSDTQSSYKGNFKNR